MSVEEKRQPKEFNVSRELSRINFNYENIVKIISTTDGSLLLGLCTYEKNLKFTKECNEEEFHEYIFWVYFSLKSKTYKKVEYIKGDSEVLMSALKEKGKTLELTNYFFKKK